ncbi:acrosin-like [Indicator indicator]|uniref:acrosin-like n=1 Tax=Indicator indicator TaxID=1002788 RepID=UPI0023DEEFFF|nr:acrosin-like [Indicator indicator]
MKTFLPLLVLLALCQPALAFWNYCGTCGFRPMASYHGTSRVVGGVSAQPGAWPWIVSIQQAVGAGMGHICGGSLISSQWVLTAAHCFVGTGRTYYVLAGITYFNKPGPEAQLRHVRRILLHRGYDNDTMSNDIALLELDQPVQCGYQVQLACVPDASLHVAELTNCWVSGWGATRARAGDLPLGLQEARVYLIDLNICNSSHWYAGAIHSHNLCAGYPQGRIDTCQGDSGGPLVCQAKNADYFWLVGVTSWGTGCARVRKPGIYTSTQHFYRWILVQMGLYPCLG